MGINKKVIWPLFVGDGELLSNFKLLVDQSGQIVPRQSEMTKQLSALDEDEQLDTEVPLSVWLNQIALFESRLSGHEVGLCELCDTTWHYCQPSSEPKIPVRLTHAVEAIDGRQKFGFATVWVYKKRAELLRTHWVTGHIGPAYKRHEYAYRPSIQLRTPSDIKPWQDHDRAQEELTFELYKTFRDTFESRYYHRNELSKLEKSCEWCLKKGAHKWDTCESNGQTFGYGEWMENLPPLPGDKEYQLKEAFEEGLSD